MTLRISRIPMTPYRLHLEHFIPDKANCCNKKEEDTLWTVDFTNVMRFILSLLY